MPNPQVGTMVDAYRIEDMIGSGSVSDVFRGTDIRLHRRVAIKLMSEKHRSNGLLRQRFAREGRAIAAVSHPNVVQVRPMIDDKQPCGPGPRQLRDPRVARSLPHARRPRPADLGIHHRAAAFSPTGRVLTIGCVAGRETFALEQLGYDAAGVDICAELLQTARQIGAQRQHRAAFHLIDGDVLPFGDGSFDVVTLWAQMLDNVPSRAGRLALMREVRRVLRPGGAATFSAHDDARTRPGYDPGDIVVADAPEPGDLVIHERREAAIRYCHLFSREELTALLRDAGFTDSVLHHTSDFGETWDNVFVGVCR